MHTQFTSITIRIIALEKFSKFRILLIIEKNYAHVDKCFPQNSTTC